MNMKSEYEKLALVLYCMYSLSKKFFLQKQYQCTYCCYYKILEIKIILFYGTFVPYFLLSSKFCDLFAPKVICIFDSEIL